MADYIELKTQKLGEGVCQKCSGNYNELNFATLASGNKTKSYVLCNNCLAKLQNKVDARNAELNIVNNNEKTNKDDNDHNDAVRAENIVREETQDNRFNTITSPSKTVMKPRKTKKIIAISVVLFFLISGFVTASILYLRFRTKDVNFPEIYSALEQVDRSFFEGKFNGRNYLVSISPTKKDGDLYSIILYDSYGNKWEDSEYASLDEIFIPVTWSVEVGKTYCVKAELIINYFEDPVAMDVRVKKMLDETKVKAKSDNTSGINDNFKIEGKWKNVGDTSCAQMQAGSITSFDGTHCNVYSPNDTYAFYEANGSYHLDCTSFFAGDSMNFAVRIIDNDNIELIYSGNTTVKLQRVG